MVTLTKKGFTLVELLVVITILAIISVVAYQNFGWAVDKAVSWRKISDVSTIESSLQQFKVDKNYYPAVWVYDATNNMWWYDAAQTARASNSIVINPSDMNGSEITKISGAAGGWKVMWISDGTNDWTGKQIWAKWVISQNIIWKQYLTKDLYDPELWDMKVWNWKMIDHGVWRYVYAVFRKPLSADTTWTSNRDWTYYNIAYTVKVDGSDKYVTRIVWDYDKESCFDEKWSCPNSLIGSSSDVLSDNQENSSSDITATNQWIPYPVSF